MSKELKSFQEVVRGLAEKYNIPFEIVENIGLVATKKKGRRCT